LNVLTALDNPASEGLAQDIKAVETQHFVKAVQRQTVDGLSEVDGQGYRYTFKQNVSHAPIITIC